MTRYVRAHTISWPTAPVISLGVLFSLHRALRPQGGPARPHIHPRRSEHKRSALCLLRLERAYPVPEDRAASFLLAVVRQSTAGLLDAELRRSGRLLYPPIVLIWIIHPPTTTFIFPFFLWSMVLDFECALHEKLARPIGPVFTPHYAAA